MWLENCVSRGLPVLISKLSQQQNKQTCKFSKLHNWKISGWSLYGSGSAVVVYLDSSRRKLNSQRGNENGASNCLSKLNSHQKI